MISEDQRCPVPDPAAERVLPCRHAGPWTGPAGPRHVPDPARASRAPVTGRWQVARWRSPHDVPPARAGGWGLQPGSGLPRARGKGSGGGARGARLRLLGLAGRRCRGGDGGAGRDRGRRQQPVRHRPWWRGDGRWGELPGVVVGQTDGGDGFLEHSLGRLREGSGGPGAEERSCRHRHRYCHSSSSPGGETPGGSGAGEPMVGEARPAAARPRSSTAASGGLDGRHRTGGDLDAEVVEEGGEQLVPACVEVVEPPSSG